MKNYRVLLREYAPGVKLLPVLLFDCSADDPEHAREQARDMYPCCEIVAVNIRTAALREI